ncbi:MAG: 2,3-bisphosphoglycerate-independent phosphoglycerate mutase [Saprospiraceae bacterium]|nr:2,3-bisphosphoglycerate-independent phosphoglycerate mutase [Saprospiraceae bacterium]
MTRKAALIILDGWGHGLNPEVSALAQAETPFIDNLYHQYPNAELVTFGEEVGLPEGQMGNSEVGHLNIGAGRIVYQELARINKEIRDKTLAQNTVLQKGIEDAKSTTKRIHLLGLVSDGGVHSHINHLLALCEILKNEEVEVFIHAFLDGRDTDPKGGYQYLKTVEEAIKGTNAKIATVIGRYYAMDRDNRWERVQKAYHLLVNGKGEMTEDVLPILKEQYEEGITDEFMAAIQATSDGKAIGNIQDGDTVIFYNYRTDRPRELTKVLTQEDNPTYDMCTLDLNFLTMTNYDASFKGLKVIFEKDNLVNTIGEVVADKGLSQVRIAETEKYPHVTFFFSGGREEPFQNEKRILAASPDVPTYDLQPEMSAQEITDRLIECIKEDTPDFICLNYANTDMVGHTGVFEAGKKAASFIDGCLERLVPTMLDHEYSIIVIADHGNSDIMINPDGSPHTAHTTNMVPVFFISNEEAMKNVTIRNGKLGDIAPTLLHVMNIEKPEEMDGDVLLS